MSSFVAFHYRSYGTFCIHKNSSSIISAVVLPTTEIIEPLFLLSELYWVCYNKKELEMF